MDSIHHYHSLLSHTTTNNVMPYPSPTAFTTSCLLISCAHLASSLASISPCNASLLPPPNNHSRQNVNNQHHACRDSVTLLYQLHRLNSACHCYHQTTSFPTRSSKPTIQNGQRRARTPTDPDLPLAHLLVQHRRLHRHHPQTTAWTGSTSKETCTASASSKARSATATRSPRIHGRCSCASLHRSRNAPLVSRSPRLHTFLPQFCGRRWGMQMQTPVAVPVRVRMASIMCVSRCLYCAARMRIGGTWAGSRVI